MAAFGFAVNNRKKNQQTGQWEEEPVFLDCEAFNRGEFGKTADLIEQYLRKGYQAYIEGHLKLDHLISSHIKLDEINEGYTKLKGGHVLRQLIDFGVAK